MTYDPAANTSTVLLGPPITKGGGVKGVRLYPGREVSHATISRCAVLASAATAFAVTVGAPASAQPVTPATGCADLGGTVRADQKCHVETKTATYSIEISYPLDYSDQQALTDFVKQDRDEFVDFIATLPPRDWPYEHGVRPHTYTSRKGGLRH